MKSLIFFTCMALSASLANANQMQYVLWQWQQSSCNDCPIAIKFYTLDFRSPEVATFIKTIVDHKTDLVELYQADPQEYNLLAKMAVGILGRESRFYTSPRYAFKENFQFVISFFKLVDSVVTEGSTETSPNSRGPTQIKLIPPKIAKKYGFNESELDKPKFAALATMGYLIEALEELKKRKELNDLKFVTEATYVDYLPYIYFGAKRTLLNGKATPKKNIYVQDMKRYMSLVEIFEIHPR